jgi:hypothetical protein
MRNFTLLVASVLLVVNVAKASNDVVTRHEFSFDEPISFIDRGIEFFVFPNGDFDFNTRPDDSHGDYYFKGAGKKGADVQNRGSVGRTPINYGVLIEHDSFGRVRRVGNTFINYDFNDRVTRIGSVFMRYNRFALTQVGNLHIVYDRRGNIIDMFGEVKGFRNHGFTNTYYGTANCDYNNDYSYTYTNNDDYYYYKADGTRAKIEDKK